MNAYRPPFWLPEGHAQTIVAALRPPPRVALVRERWDAPDGDFIDVDWAGPRHAKHTLVLFHGLEGSSDSHYARDFAAHAIARDWRIALPHFRGCSGEPNRLPRAYHSGDSGEVDWILRRVAASSPAPHAVGVSLGGNALLKWLGERSAEAARIVRRAAAVSAPLDLSAAGRALDRGFNREVYTRMFLATLKKKALDKLDRFPGLYDAERVRGARSFHEFDSLVTAPLHGFRDAEDYWRKSSSAPWLQSVCVPTLVLNAGNDPFLPEAALDAATREVSSEVLLERPSEGGHVGFLEAPFPGRHGWLSRRVFDFLAGA